MQKCRTKSDRRTMSAPEMRNLKHSSCYKRMNIAAWHHPEHRPTRILRYRAYMSCMYTSCCVPDLRVRRMRTHFGDRAFSAAGPRCWNSLPLKLCADVIVSAAARRSISVGGGGAPPVKKIGGGGAAWAAKNIFF